MTNFYTSFFRGIMPALALFKRGGVTELLAWVGTISYLIAYLFLSIGRLKAGKPLYHILNLIGAIGLIVHALSLNDNQNLIVNIFWMAIALLALYLIVTKRYRE